jgi:hypothetical protein
VQSGLHIGLQTNFRCKGATHRLYLVNSIIATSQGDFHNVMGFPCHAFAKRVGQLIDAGILAV